MKRDMDKVRAVLLALEERKQPYFLMMNPELLGGIDNPGEMVEYLMMLKSGDLLEEKNSAYRITWMGHEFIDSIRDPEIWRKTKEGAAKVGSWSLKLMGEMATGFIRLKATELGLPIS
jgi:hypothetical protein